MYRALYGGVLGHGRAHVRRRIAQIRSWAEEQGNSFIDELLAANPTLEQAAPAVTRNLTPEIYIQAYGFTCVEAEVAAAFVGGRKLAEIAADRGCSINTVRTHFAHIKDKLGLHTQTEVLRELMKVA